MPRQRSHGVYPCRRHGSLVPKPPGAGRPLSGSGGRMYRVAGGSAGNPMVIIGGGMAGGNAAATLAGRGFPGPAVAWSRERGAGGSAGNPMGINGGGMAGGNAAATLRGEGFPGPVVVLSREPGVPFGRPPLSKTYLRSEEALSDWYVRPDGWYADHDVELRRGTTAAAVDPAAHALTLDSGEELGYLKVLVATGGRNRRLGIPGADLPGIHYLRTVAECDAIKREALPGRRAVVVGMGFIGSEVAASLTQLGVRVTAIFPGRAPLETVLGGQVGALMGAIHRANGVELLPGGRVAAFEGTERLEAAVTAGGQRIS